MEFLAIVEEIHIPPSLYKQVAASIEMSENL
jgi:hypothetical protein